MKILVLFTTLITVSVANAFEWHGLKSGMTKEQAGEVLISGGFNEEYWKKCTRYGTDAKLPVATYPDKLMDYDRITTPFNMLNAIELRFHPKYGLYEMLLRFSAGGRYSPSLEQKTLALSTYFKQVPEINTVSTRSGPLPLLDITVSDDKVIEIIKKEEFVMYSKQLRGESTE